MLETPETCILQSHSSRRVSLRAWQQHSSHGISVKLMQALLMTFALVLCRQLACPICMKSYADLAAIWRRVDEEVASTPMPEEYACWVAHILCNDCNKVCGSFLLCLVLKRSQFAADENRYLNTR